MAIQLGITPGEAEEIINQLTGIETEQLRQLIESIQGRLEELERRIEELNGKVNILEREVKGFRIYKLNEIADGELYPNIELIGDDLGIISETYGRLEVNVVKAGKFNEYLRQLMDELGKGPVALIGSRGVGKSVLAIYAIWSLLKKGDYYGVIKVEELIDVNARLSLENFLRTYVRDFTSVFGRLIILYDPSSTETYTRPGVAIEVKPIEDTIRQLMNLAGKLSELKVSLVMVMPSDMYDELSEEAKAFLSKYMVNIDLRDEELLKAIIKEYSGCGTNEDELKGLINEILRFNEGYIIIARMIGENLRVSNCMLESIRDILGRSQGDATAFMVNWINDYLGVVSRERNEPIPQRIRALAEVLTIREPFKAGLRPSNYVATPYIMDRLTYWSSGGQVGLSRELANWLAIRHEDLLEDAITKIVKAARGEEIKGTNYLSNALNPWKDYGELGTRVDTANDAIKYLVNNYGDKLKKISKKLGNDCWDALILTFSAVWGGHKLNIILSSVKNHIDDLMPMVKSAVEFLSSANKAGECDAFKLLVMNGETPPLTHELLLMGEKDVNNPILDALAEGRNDRVKEALDLYMKIIKNEERREPYLIENLYALGLAALTAYAVLRDFKEYVNDGELKVKALETVDWSMLQVGEASAVSRIINLLIRSGLSDLSLDLWASILRTATGPLIGHETQLHDLILPIDNLWIKHDKLKDWSKAFLIEARADTMSSRITNEKTCKVFNELMNIINNEIKSKALRLLIKAYVYWRLAESGIDCSIDIKPELEALINLLEYVDLDNWVKDWQLIEYLRHYETWKDALLHLIRGRLAGLYYAIGMVSMSKGNFDDAVEYFKKSREINKELENWPNYITSFDFIIRTKAIRSSSVRELLEIGREFKEAYREAVKKLGPTANELMIHAYLLAGYLAYLSITNNNDKVKDLMREYNWLLEYVLDVDVATKLFLNWLGVSIEKPSVKKIINVIEVHLWPGFAPALKGALGIKIDCSEECGKYADYKLSMLCNLACSAVKGNRNKYNELIDSIRNVINSDLVNGLANYDPRAFIQAIAPITSRASFILALNALVNNDYGSVRAIAMYCEHAFSTSIIQKLFKELREAIERDNKDIITLALAKLFYYHI